MKIQEKEFESANIGLAHFKILIFFRLFKYGGRVGKGIVKFCHPLQVANFSMLLVQNSLCYLRPTLEISLFHLT